MLGIQVAILLFCLFAIVRALGQVRRGQLSLVRAAGWVLFWLAVGLVALLPQTTQWFANRLGVGRGADLVIYVSLAALFYLVFRLFVKLERVEQDMSQLVRSIALKEDPHD
ncbi:DUF2304 domain-containing protein [Candidatus Uhrbacteria bacterium]|nr:DUF2304 domain-containing protein [Candidatus Uhrbacteria bacterium]